MFTTETQRHREDKERREILGKHYIISLLLLSVPL